MRSDASTVIDERTWQFRPVLFASCFVGMTTLLFFCALLTWWRTTAVALVPWCGLIALETSVFIAMRKVAIRADRRATGVDLEIVYGLRGWPRQHFAAEKIRSVTVEPDIRPQQWGGWGYRGSLTLFRRAGLISRRGEGIVVHLTNGARLAITVDEAAAFARHFG